MIAIALIDAQRWVLSITSFHEKAGRSQVDSVVLSLDKVCSARRVATVATLPSAPFDERFSLGAQLGVLVSAGAATC